MADPVSLCASIIGIAGAGYQLAATLETIFRADDSLKHAAQDISLTSSVLQELGKLLEADVSGRNRICSANATKTAEEAMRSCKSIFDEFQAALQSSLRKRTHSSFDDKRSLSALGKLKWPVTSRKMDYLRSNLDKLKSTLNLLLGVLSYAKHLSTEEHANAQVTELMRGGIERLMRLDTESAERHHYVKRAYETNNLHASSTVNRPYDSCIMPSSAQQRFATNSTLLVGNPGPAASEMIAGSLAEARAAPYSISKKEASSIQRLPSLPPPPPKQRSYNLTWADMSRCQSAVLHLLSYINGIIQQFEQGKDLREPDLKICAVYDDVKKVLDEHISMGALRLANSFHTSPYDTSPQPEIRQASKESAATAPAAGIEDPRQQNPAIEVDSVPLAQLENEEARSKRWKQAELDNAANLSGVYEHIEGLEPYEASQEHYQLPVGHDWPNSSMFELDGNVTAFCDVGYTYSSSDVQSVLGVEPVGEGRWTLVDQPSSSTVAGSPQTAVYPSMSEPSTDSKAPEIRRKVTKYAMINRPRTSNMEQGRPEDFVTHTHADEEKQRESLGTVHGTAAAYYDFLVLPDHSASRSRQRARSYRPCSQPDPTVTRNVPAELNTGRHRSTVPVGRVKRRQGEIPLAQQMPQQRTPSTQKQSPSTDTETTSSNPGFNAKPLHIPATMSTSDGQAIDLVTMSPSTDQTALAAQRQAQRLPSFWSTFQKSRMGVHVRENPTFVVGEDPVEENPVNELIKKWTLLDAEKIHRPSNRPYFGQNRRV